MNDTAASAAHAKKAADRFDQWAEDYGEDRISRWFQHYQEVALNIFNFKGDEHFLDIGCGTGWAVRKAASMLPNGSAHGIDISPLMIEKAMHLTQADQNCRFNQANVESIPWKDNHFDCILCTFSFHHYHDPIAALREIHRVLKKGGTLVIVDSARDVSLAIWLQDRWRRYLEHSHVKYYRVDEMKNLINESDFAFKEDIGTEKGILKLGKTFTGLMVVVCCPV